jgi:hypothetical protein
MRAHRAAGPEGERKQVCHLPDCECQRVSPVSRPVDGDVAYNRGRIDILRPLRLGAPRSGRVDVEPSLVFCVEPEDVSLGARGALEDVLLDPAVGEWA